MNGTRTLAFAAGASKGNATYRSVMAERAETRAAVLSAASRILQPDGYTRGRRCDRVAADSGVLNTSTQQGRDVTLIRHPTVSTPQGHDFRLCRHRAESPNRNVLEHP